MIIKTVKVVNFRNHDEYLLECKKKTSLITGENGSGKTSILEAIYIAMRGRSFRAVDKDILKRGREFYRIELDYLNGDKVVVVYDGQKKQFVVNEKKYYRLMRNRQYPVILFEPSDLNLVEASQTKRREYFNKVFSNLDVMYYENLLKYEKALKQRNGILKNYPIRREHFFSWNLLLAKYGCEIRRARRKIIDEINQVITERYRSIAQNDDLVKIIYDVEEMDESAYLKKLEENIEKDEILGHTTYGAHRDEINFCFNDKIANGSASRGEVRSMILALKFIEAEMVFERTQKKALILLDDVFSELDRTRQKCLVENFKSNQVILTSVEDI